MDTNALIVVMTVFVIISAIALCVQAGYLFGMYKAVRTLQDRLTPLMPKVEALVDSTKATVDESKQQIIEITTKANDILESTKHQLAMVEEVVADATSRAKVQMERVELVLDDTMSRAHETVATFHSGIMRPLREINGIAIGIKTAFAHLTRGGRPSVAQATSDEEMFI
jgi:ElaB/YqjD/DUF883 family membrane-anchored ribosome-binding protein